jgi:peptide/nickel transport system substrate-binding protein
MDREASRRELTVENNYWSRQSYSRRSVLRGGGLGIAGLAGAALLGCSGGSDESGGESSGSTATGKGTPAAGQVRIAPGQYGSLVPPSAAEQDPLKNGKRGGTLLATYLDPPHMDLNRVLSCTVVHPMAYTQNKLVRGKTGPKAHPDLVEIEGDLAEKWEVAPDSMTYTFHLRKGVKTHNVAPTNGREYTSEDVKLSLERYRKGGTQSDIFSDVTSIEAPDKYTVIVKHGTPRPDFATDIAAYSFLWVKEMIEKEDELRSRAIGTGPFVQAEWKPKERSIFERNPDYFKTGLPFLDRIETYVQSDTAVLRAGFQTDNFWNWTARDELDLEEMGKTTKDVVSSRQPLSNIPNTRGWWFQMNNQKWQDPRVRRAISLAFSRDAFDEAQDSGDNLNPDGAFSFISTPPWPLLFDKYPTAKEQGPYYKFNPQEASRMMQAAGYTAANPLKFQIVGFYQRTIIPQVVIPMLRENLKELDVSYREVDNPTHATLMADRNFEDALGYLIPSFLSFDMCTYPWYHSKGATNYKNVKDPEMDRLLEQQRTLSNPQERKEVWRKIWDRVHDQVWEIAYPAAHRREAWHNYVMNYRPHSWMGAYTCYTNDQAESMWLDEGAPMRKT